MLKQMTNKDDFTIEILIIDTENYEEAEKQNCFQQHHDQYYLKSTGQYTT